MLNEIVLTVKLTVIQGGMKYATVLGGRMQCPKIHMYSCLWMASHTFVNRTFRDENWDSSASTMTRLWTGQ